MRIEKNTLINYHDDPDVTKLLIPPEVKKIAPHAFYGAEYLEEVVISDGVTEIGAEAFSGCHELRSVIMPDSVTEMGKKVFADCHKLCDVRLSAGLYNIPECTFDCCHSLVSIEIPEGVRIIGYDAFNSCIALTSVDLPDSVNYIDNGAFMETFSLKDITIPGFVEDIGAYTFFRSGVRHIHYRYMDIFLDRTELNFDSIEFCFERGLHKWLREGCTGTVDFMPREMRYPFISAHFAATRDPRTAEYIKKRFPTLFGHMVRAGNIPAVRAVIEYGGFLSSRNINTYITHAAKQENKEIFLMLTAHKKQLGAYKNTNGRFRL